MIGQPKAVIVDDDPVRAMRIRLLPALSELWPVVARTGEAARSLVRVTDPLVVLVSVDTDSERALRTISSLRADRFRGPLLALAALKAKQPASEFVEAGATTVLAWPPNNLLLFEYLVSNGVLHPRDPGTPHTDTVVLGNSRVDLRRGVIRRADVEIPLTAMQRILLVALLQHRGAVALRSTLTAILWPDGSPEHGRLDRHVSALRCALDDRSEHQRFLVTERGVGFRLVDAVWPDQRLHAGAPSTREIS